MDQNSTDEFSLVSVIIVNWNGAQFLNNCLSSLKAQTYKKFEIIVIDNGSNDGSVDNLEINWPDIRIERLKKNRGFAAANNLGTRIGKGSWIALLNNDAFPSPEWLQNLINASKKYPEFSFFASRLVMANKTNYIDGMGDIYHVSGIAWRRGHGKLDESHSQTAFEVFGPCAAAAFYPRALFLQIGGFDEDFYCYHEDVDLSFRLRLQGHRCLYVPEAIVKHVGSGSSGADSDFVRYYSHRNLVWTYIKNMPSPLIWWYLPAHLIFNLISIIWFFCRGQGGVIWRAKRDALRGLSTVLNKRREIQRIRRVKYTEIKKNMDSHWLNPYLKPYKRKEKIIQFKKESI